MTAWEEVTSRLVELVKTDPPLHDAIVRLVEATGDSTKSWDAAVLAAVKAAKVKAPVGVEVGRLWAELDGPKLSRYHASVKVAYREVQRSPVQASR